MQVQMQELSDGQLAGLVARRQDETAFGELLRRHAPAVHRLASVMVGAGSADDVVQEVFMTLLNKAGQYRGEAALSTWLHRVALNACHARLRQRQSERLDEVPEPQSASSPARHAETLDLRERLHRALAHLNPEQREVLVLRELSGLDYAEIAELTGVTLGTVKSRLNRGRAALRDLLIPQEVTP